jgi:hypothetical protein
VGHAIRDKQPVKFRNTRGTDNRSMSPTMDVNKLDTFTQRKDNMIEINRYLRSQRQNEMIIPHQSYLQQNEFINIDDLTISRINRPFHQYDTFQEYALRCRIASRISNTLIRLSLLESQVLMSLRQQAYLDTLRSSTVGLSTL